MLIGQKAHLPIKAIVTGITVIPAINTTPTAKANIGPIVLNDPDKAKISNIIATIVVEADPIIDGATFLTVSDMARNLF